MAVVEQFDMSRYDAAAAISALVTTVGFLGIVFFFTPAGAWVKDYTLVNRAILHLVSMLMFFVMALLWDKASRSQCVTAALNSAD
jgi:hypothetical protein